MRRAVVLSILIHGLLFVALSAWLATRVEPPQGPPPMINVRLAPVSASHGADEEQPSDSGAQLPQPAAPAEQSAPDDSNPPNESARDVPVAAAPPARSEPLAAAAVESAAPIPPAPATDLSPPAPLDEPAQMTRPAQQPPSPSTTSESAALVSTTVPQLSRTPVAAPAARPLSARQKRMLDKKLRRWAAQLPATDPDQPSLTWRDGEQHYTARFQTLQAAGETGMEKVLVEISTEEDGARLSTQMRMRRLAFSNFAQFVDRWDPSVQIHDDELDGRFHSNSQITVLYDRKVMPVFHGKVTTAARSVNTSQSRGRSRKDAIFAGGLETGVRRISLPREYLPFPDEGPGDPEQTHYFDSDTRITFHADGSYTWRSNNGGAGAKRPPAGDGPLYLLGVDKARFFLKGTVRGQILVHTPTRIVIEGNLVYADYPGLAEDSGNFLGLVAGKTVEIAAPQVTGPGDLVINAAIYAKRRFLVRRYRHRDSALLTIFGSVTAGSVSATEPRYATRIRFDPRLKEMRPPRFPLSDRYELEAWDGQWAVTRAAREPDPFTPGAKGSDPDSTGI